MLYLSKSRYCNAIQCPKMLWLTNNKKEEFDASVLNEGVLETGNEVGDLAMGLLGDYIEVPYGKPSEMIEATKIILEGDAVNIAEASFSYNGLFCSVDLLEKKGNNHVNIYEVKSSTSLHEIYKHDVSYQYYVLTKLGYKVDQAYLVHLNRQYVRVGDLDLQQLFTKENLTQEAISRYQEVEENIHKLEIYLASNKEPAQELGSQCFDPYDCGYFQYCTSNLPKPNLFDLMRVQKRTIFKLYDQGIISFEDIEKNHALSASNMLQVSHTLHVLEDVIEEKKIREFMNTLSYPIYFLDFESFQPAIPIYDYTRSFDQIVFQYSLHYIEYEGGPLLHKEYLAYPNEDPRRKLAKRLVEDIPENGCVTAYNMSFERTRIKELASLYPDLADHLLKINENMIDLMVPFQKQWYYTRDMKGSYSIKYVLPALFPNDPSLDYHSLEGVHNGSEASNTFKQMATMEAKELEEYRHYLLKYCELDTYAMVKIWEKLKSI